MARENVELVQSVCSAWGRGDYSSIEWAHAEIEFVIADDPSPDKWTGLAGMAEGWQHRSAGVFHVGVRKVTRFVAYLAKTASACSPTSGCRSSGGDCCQPLLVAAAALIRVIVPRGLYRDTLVATRCAEQSDRGERLAVFVPLAGRLGSSAGSWEQR